jgi:hypothetical protein
LPETILASPSRANLAARPKLANQLFVVAGTDKAVPLANPTDLALDPKNPVAALGTLTDGRFTAIFFDGHIEMIDAKIEPAKLVAMIGPDVEMAATTFVPTPPMAPHLPIRTWTDVQGRKLEARLLKIDGDNVQLEKADGKPFSVPRDRLSQEDQDYVKSAFK